MIVPRMFTLLRSGPQQVFKDSGPTIASFVELFYLRWVLSPSLKRLRRLFNVPQTLLPPPPPSPAFAPPPPFDAAQTTSGPKASISSCKASGLALGFKVWGLTLRVFSKMVWGHKEMQRGFWKNRPVCCELESSQIPTLSPEPCKMPQALRVLDVVQILLHREVRRLRIWDSVAEVRLHSRLAVLTWTFPQNKKTDRKDSNLWFIVHW